MRRAMPGRRPRRRSGRAGRARRRCPACSTTCRWRCPALTRAAKLQRRAARVGFDWPEPVQVVDKIEEEIAELRAELGRRRERRSAERRDRRSAVRGGQPRAPSGGRRRERRCARPTPSSSAAFARSRTRCAPAAAASPTPRSTRWRRSGSRPKRRSGLIAVAVERRGATVDPAQAGNAAGAARPLHRPGDRRPGAADPAVDHLRPR